MTNIPCIACSGDAEPLSPEALAVALTRLPHWQVAEEQGIRSLRRCYLFPDFAQALAAANKVGELAEAYGHHPDLLLSWGALEVRWWSHKIKSIHEIDVVLAEACERMLAA